MSKIILAIILFCTTCVLVTGTGCSLKDDSLIDVNTKSGNRSLNNNNCDVYMGYDAEITTLIRPADASDQDQLTELDKLLMLPRRDRRHEQVCIGGNGSYTITTEIGTPDHPIEYPENTIGVWPKPAYKSIINNNGSVVFYNELGEQIDDSSISNESSSALDIINMFNDLKNYPVISDAEFEEGLNAISAEVLPMATHDNRVFTTKVVHSDDSYSIGVIDKNARMQIGQLNYSPDNKLLSLYMLKVSGQAPNVTFQKMVHVTFFNALESQIRMRMEQITEFKSFTITQH